MRTFSDGTGMGLLQSYSLWSGRNDDCTFLLKRLAFDEAKLINEQLEGRRGGPAMKIDIVHYHDI